MISEHVSSFGGLPSFLYGPDDEETPADPSSVAWRLDVESDDEDFGALLDAFLDEIPGDQVRAVVIGPWGRAYRDPIPAGLLAAAAPRLPNLRALFLGDLVSEESEISWIQQTDLTELLTAYPELEELRIRGGTGLALGPLRHDALRRLTIETGGLSGGVVRSVGASDLPALRSLTLWLGEENYGGDASTDDLRELLSGVRLGSLRHLGLCNAQIADQVAAAVATAPIVPRLETLDLSLGALTDRGADALLAGRSLTHLRRLDLHHHFLSPGARERLTAALPGVEIDLSDPQEPSQYGDRVRRFIAVGE
nr:STM4015 family protein [uncultured Actinoplanes sp.]